MSTTNTKRIIENYRAYVLEILRHDPVEAIIALHQEQNNLRLLGQIERVRSQRQPEVADTGWDLESNDLKTELEKALEEVAHEN